MSGHGGGGYRSSAMGSARGAGSVQSWIAAQGSGTGALARLLGSGADALRGSTAIAGILKAFLEHEMCAVCGYAC